MRFRPKGREIDAYQWFRNGDHPNDGVNGEGRVVRYFRHPSLPGDEPCGLCSRRLHDHGFIDSSDGGRKVCPGDWVVTSSAPGNYYPITDEARRRYFEPAGPPT